jgi:hypothetical protein
MALAYLAHQPLRRPSPLAIVKAALLASAFLLWAAYQLNPPLPLAVNDPAITLFVLDIALVIGTDIRKSGGGGQHPPRPRPARLPALVQQAQTTRRHRRPPTHQPHLTRCEVLQLNAGGGDGAAEEVAEVLECFGDRPCLGGVGQVLPAGGAEQSS